MKKILLFVSAFVAIGNAIAATMNVELSDGTVVSYDAEKVTRVSFDAVKMYTVNFYGMDSTLINTQLVEEGTAAKEVTAPTIEGYLFTNWSVATNNVTSNLEVYAQYAKGGDMGAIIDPD
ncbi:MAG: hypothetical protein MJZ23_03340 [Paludibacteraceae bacterium]|nr:hypothetical protein [Paludibacteraceae bacterium]